MIPREREAEILRLYHGEKWKVGTIAAELGIHHSTVQRVLSQGGATHEQLRLKPSIVDPYVPFILETLEKHPRLRASRLYVMIRQRGFKGSPGHFRSLVARLRPKPPAEAYLRVRTLPGEEAQVDWAHFGKVTIGQATRPLFGFVMVLSYSRQIFLRFYFTAQMASFLRGHVDAFHFFGGVPRRLLYDNLKSAVLERAGDAIKFHPTLLELAAHYHFLPRPVAPARGNEKGRVERAIRYIRDSFFAARAWRDLADLNAQALEWMQGIAADRPCPEERARTVRDVFAQEKSLLLPLPNEPFPTDEHVEVEVGKTPYVRFDLNDYSVPHTYVRRTLAVSASIDTVRILDGTNVLAIHGRSFDRGQQIEQREHIDALVAEKREAREGRVVDHVHHALPHARALLQLIAERGGNLGSMIWSLSRLLESTRAEELDAALAEVVDQGTPHLGAIRLVLDKRRQERGEPPPVSTPVRNDRFGRLVVRPHSLSTYDQLTKDSKDTTNEKD